MEGRTSTLPTTAGIRASELKLVFTTFLVETLLYGIHLVLFSVCACILAKRVRSFQYLIFFLATLIMFALATVDVGVSFRFIYREMFLWLKREINTTEAVRHLLAKNIIFITNNFIADSLLLYRCYMVWGMRKYIFLVPALLLVAESIWGYSGSKTAIAIGLTLDIWASLYFGSAFIFNLSMSVATAGRIWWVSRGALPLIGKRQMKRYYTAIAILVESGAIYSIALMLYVITTKKPYQPIFLVIVMRMVGIIPTLMVVQVELCRNHQVTNGTNTLDSELPTSHRIPLSAADSPDIT